MSVRVVLDVRCRRQPLREGPLNYARALLLLALTGLLIVWKKSGIKKRGTVFYQ